ncbi:MAG: hypothetical protein DME55_07365 [Verrucomicrobia bacterium]|nr:MAG: hypothetical protein DME55_07365 [Verrucomicrobiota bacterium]
MKYGKESRCSRFWCWPRRERSADIRSDLGQASNAGRRQKRRNLPGASRNGGSPRRSLVATRYGYAPDSLLATHISRLYARPIPVFHQSLE